VQARPIIILDTFSLYSVTVELITMNSKISWWNCQLGPTLYNFLRT